MRCRDSLSHGRGLRSVRQLLKCDDLNFHKLLLPSACLISGARDTIAQMRVQAVAKGHPLNYGHFVYEILDNDLRSRIAIDGASAKHFDQLTPDGEHHLFLIDRVRRRRLYSCA